MKLLILGLLLWSFVHFIPSIAAPMRSSLIDRFGLKPYSAVFAILIVSSLVLIVCGWRSITPTFLYALPMAVKHIALLLIVVAFVLFGAAKYPTRIKRIIRHPQLTGVMVWATAHLLMNGDSRSVVLFGGLGVWAMLEIMLINKREGQWIKPDPPSWKQELKGGLISMVVLIVVVFLHPYFTGLPVR